MELSVEITPPVERQLRFTVDVTQSEIDRISEEVVLLSENSRGEASLLYPTLWTLVYPFSLESVDEPY